MIHHDDLYTNYYQQDEDSPVELLSTYTHPDHYKSKSGTQVMDVIKDFFTPEERDGFIKGNVIKYLLRAGKKGPAELDYEKALTYMEMLSNAYEMEKP